MKYILLGIMALAMPALCHAQANNAFGQRLTIGTSVTHIWEDNPDVSNTYNETTWEKNIAVSLTRSLYFGLSHKHIFTWGSSVAERQNDKARYHMFGPFVQYDFLPDKASRLIAEVSYNVGDYCTCGTLDPYRVAGLSYLGWGFGYDMPLWRGLSLDLAFTAQYILNEIQPFSYSYTQYIIGLNYTLERDRLNHL